MTPAEAKELLPFVQAIADGKVVEERWVNHYDKTWSAWHSIESSSTITSQNKYHELRIVEPEPTQEEVDEKAFHDWVTTQNKRLNPWPIETWKAALAWERKRTSGGAR